MKAFLFDRLRLKGQSMIEVAIALAIASVIIVALLSSVLSSLNNAEFSNNTNQATQYSQQAIETMRAIQRADVPNMNETYCLDADLPPTLEDESVCDTQPNMPDNIFIRKVTLDDNAAECNGLTQVTAQTFWADGKCSASDPFCHKSTLVSCVGHL